MVVESWDLPSYTDLVRGMYEYLETSYNDAFVENRPPTKLVSWNITSCDITYVVVLTAVISTLRFVLSKRVFLPIANHYDIPDANRKNVPEAAFAFTFIFCCFCYEWYVMVLSGKYKFLQKSETMWHGWSIEAVPSGDIYSIYVIKTAFYLYWTYATLFLDTWRKNSAALALHHVLALILIFIFNATRCHNVGVLIFFLGDICHVLHESSKLSFYFKIQGGRVKKWMEMMSHVLVGCFTAMWVPTRLHWFSLTVVYSLAVHPRRLKLDIPYLLPMNLMLWVIQILQIYWFVLILKVFLRIVSGEKLLKDPSEFDVAEKNSEQSSPDGNCSNNSLKEKCSMKFS